MATFSNCGKYRFKLWRTHGASDENQKPNILFIMLNPSTGSENKDDKTIRILRYITDKWNYGNIYVGNIYPYCSSKPDTLKTLEIPHKILEENINHIRQMVTLCDLVVYAWGTKGPLGEKQTEPEWLKTIVNKTVYCIGTSVKGVPKHPSQWGDWKKSIPETPLLFREIIPLLNPKN
jgi:hypothetical protein